MKKYTIYCTEKQTMRAFKLGAPIEKARVIDVVEGKSIRIPKDNGDFYVTPTAEQMIGWLEEQKCIKDILIAKCIATWYFDIGLTIFKTIKDNNFNSRKEATLAAIDAALDYLEKNK